MTEAKAFNLIFSCTDNVLFINILKFANLDSINIPLKMEHQ